MFAISLPWLIAACHCAKPLFLFFSMELKNSIKTFNICTTRVIVDARIGKSKSAVKWNSEKQRKKLCNCLEIHRSTCIATNTLARYSPLYVGDKILPSLMVNLLGTNKTQTIRWSANLHGVRRCDSSRRSSSHVLLELLLMSDVYFIAHDTDEVDSRTKPNGYLNIDSAFVPTERKFNLLHHTITKSTFKIKFGRNIFLCCHNFYDSLSHILRRLWSTWPFLRIFSSSSDENGSKVNSHRRFALKAALQKAKALSRNSGQGRRSRSRLKRDF